MKSKSYWYRLKVVTRFVRMRLGINSAPSIRLPMILKDLVFFVLIISSVAVGIATGQPLYGAGIFLLATVLSIILRV